MDYLFQYFLFLAQAITVVVAILIVLSVSFAMGQRRNVAAAGHLEIRKLNARLDDLRHAVEDAVLGDGELKFLRKRQAKEDKKKAKADKNFEGTDRARLYVLSFNGDIQASKVDLLRREITAVLTMARPSDEVLVRVESPGGMVPHYGLAASQLHRFRKRDIPLTVAVDKVAASGGYMMAAVANKVIAAPFALVGSIGVVAELPNVHRLLEKNDVDWEVLTAGEYKRTMTVFGENTEEGRAKFVDELEDTHALFKEFVAEQRPVLDVDAVATGEAWYGVRALDRALVDELCTSDEYVTAACDDRDVYEVRWIEHKKPIERLLAEAQTLASNLSVRFAPLQRALSFLHPSRETR